jgi:hypothetical protein
MRSRIQTYPRHCEERSDAAIHLAAKKELDCFASLAMTAFPLGAAVPQTPAFQFCNRSHVDIDIPALAPAI